MKSLATAAVVICAASPAGAATVESHRIDGDGLYRESTLALTVKAAPGETNTVRADLNGETVVVRDLTAGLTDDSEYCSQTASDTVSCSSPDMRLSFGVRLGDGDDSVHLSGVEGAGLAGGPGADELRGGEGPDYLHGDSGRDVIDGRGGADRLEEGPSHPNVPADVDDDILLGGTGIDTISYVGRSNPVFVDLELGTGGGEAGEGDRISEIENIEGGFGADRLLGSPGDNRIRQEAGDVVSGRGGADTIEIRGEPAASPPIECGTGFDTVDFFESEQLRPPIDLDRFCDRISETDPWDGHGFWDPTLSWAVDLRARYLSKRRALRLRIVCCFEHVALFTPGSERKRLATWRRPPEWEENSIVLRLTELGRRRLRRGRQARVLLHVSRTIGVSYRADDPGRRVRAWVTVRR